MNVITCTESLRKFLTILRLTLLLTKLQLDHLVSIMVSAVQGVFDGKMKNVPEVSMRNIHQTSTDKFLSKSPWTTDLVEKSYQQYILASIWRQACITNLPILMIFCTGEIKCDFVAYIV